LLYHLTQTLIICVVMLELWFGDFESNLGV